jgi:hypothetical protein
MVQKQLVMVSLALRISYKLWFLGACCGLFGLHVVAVTWS